MIFYNTDLETPLGFKITMTERVFSPPFVGDNVFFFDGFPSHLLIKEQQNLRNGSKSLEVSDGEKVSLKPRPTVTPTPTPTSTEVASQLHQNSPNSNDAILDPLTPPRPTPVILKPRESSPNAFKTDWHCRHWESNPDATFGPAMQVYQRRKG